MSNSTKKKKKIFHSPERKGTLREIPATPVNRLLSAVSLVIQTGMMIFAVYAVLNCQKETEQRIISGDVSLIYLIFPLVCWVLSLGFRLACRYMPLEMWRLSPGVRRGMILTEGTLLKLITLLLELETAVCFFYIDVSLYLGYSPSDAVMLAWVAALFLSVFLPCRRAKEIAARKR